MTNRIQYIFILSLVCVAFSLSTAQTDGNSKAVQHQALPWGNADLIKTSDGVTIRFGLHQQREIQNIDSSSIPQQVQSFSCFVQVPSGKEVALKVQRSSSHRITIRNSINQIANASAPMVSIHGYRWFRGKRLAQINISAYTNNAQGIQAIDTVEVALHYKTSSIDRTSVVNAGEDKHFKKVFDALLLNPDDASNTITEPLQWIDSTGIWLPRNGKAIKLTIPNDGIYRLTYSDLTAIESELSQVDPNTFRLFNKGNELPLHVKTGSTGQFEYVEFVGQRNYNGNAYRHIPVGKEEYTEYLNRYTDTSYYWLTWGGAQGKRYVSNDTSVLSSDSIQWYTEKLHLEQNTTYAYAGGDQVEQQNPFWTSGDIWFWGWIFAKDEIDVPFAISQLNNSYPTCHITIKVANYAANSGISPVSVLKTGVNSYRAFDSTSLNQFEQKLIQNDIPLSVLSAGSNTVRLFSLPTLSSVNSVIFDWVDVEYPRTLNTATDSLWFGFSNLSNTGVKRIVIQGVTTSDILLYKVQAIQKIITGLKVSGKGPYTISFIDTVGNGDKYVLLSASKVQTPFMSLKINFANLRDGTHRADYLLITNSSYPGFTALAKSYSTFIHQTYSLNSSVIDVKDIYDEFGYGYPVPESVREFLKATTKWAAPMPSYLFLVGRANYDFKNYIKTTGGSTLPNIVPVYGMPVSDSWAAMLDDSLFVPQMYVGRLPALTDIEFQRYFQHVQAYASASYDDWNKRYIFFAGGDSSATENTIGLFHSVNSQVIQSIVQPAPVGGVTADYYKTTNPQSDYGPYSSQQFTNAIDSGAVLIGYVGHSGTQTWDNNIADIAKLQNTRGRFTLISDFGCSTAKCAEPNIRAFSELFTLDQNSSAIGYIGNSSLGFTSIATSFPQYYYRTILLDSIHTAGKAHLVSRLKTLQANGWLQADLGRQLMLTNVLIGDPALELAIPLKPNLVVSSNDLISTPSLPSDDNDFLQLKIPYHNYGSVQQDSFNVNISQTYLAAKSDTTITRKLPLYGDTIVMQYPIYNLPGTHDYAVQFNPSQKLTEINYSDNSASFSTIVQSIALRAVYPIPGFRSPATKFALMNPIKQPVNTGTTVVLEIDTTMLFTSPSVYQMPMGQVATKFSLPPLSVRQYYWRAHIGLSPAVTGSFIPSADSLTHWTQSLPDEWQKNTYTGTIHDSSGAHLASINHSIQVVSSGWLTGIYGTVEIDGANVLGSTFARGITVVQLDTMDFHIIQKGTFDTFGGTSGTDTSYAYSLAGFLNNLQQRSLVGLLVIDEGSNSLTAYARSSIKQFGSKFISNLGYRDSWALLGQKGSPAGSVLEKWVPSADSQRVTLDTVINRQSLYGELLSAPIGPASQWTKALISSTVPQGGRLRLYVLGANASGINDTLLINDTSTIIKLTSIDAKKYPSLRLLEKIWANARGISPVVQNWDVTLLPPPELAINYQCVSLAIDSVLEGTPVQMSAQIHNIGEQAAKNVQVLFSLVNNGIRQQDTLSIPTVPADSFSVLTYNLSTGGRRGINEEIITIDPQQQIAEELKINNSYSFQFFVRKDTTSPSFDITFDGQRIYDGDYVLPHPTIRIAIYDNSPLQLQNPSLVKLTLDDRRITLGSDPDSLFEVSSGPEKADVIFKPTLSGRKDPYKLWVQVQDSSGNVVSLGNPLSFVVDSVWDIKNVFNYPNPFSSETYFTFILTNYADEVEIKIYTIAGRLIQNIFVPSQSGNAYCRVYWNGRDRDGDEVANGVYFYKVLARSNGVVKEVIGKLAKVR